MRGSARLSENFVTQNGIRLTRVCVCVLRSTVNAPLSDLYDSGLSEAPLKVEVEFCKTTTSTEPIQASISLVTDGSVFASINRGTWAEGVASAQLSKLEIDIFSGCIDCGSWQEPSPGPLPNP